MYFVETNSSPSKPPIETIMMKTSAFAAPIIGLTGGKRTNIEWGSAIISRFPYYSSRTVYSRILNFGITCSATQSDTPSARSISMSSELSAAVFKGPVPQSTFGTMLTKLFNGDDDGDQPTGVVSLLKPVLAPDVEWSTPLFIVRSVEDVADNIGSLISFVESPRITVVNEFRSDNDSPTTKLEWNFSFVYPLPWRPRISFTGSSHLAYSMSNSVTAIRDSWNRSPWTVIRQALPKLNDVVWLWPSPHAETDIGLRRQEFRTRDYSVEVHAAHAELRIRSDIKPGERISVWAMGVLPSETFVGTLRRKQHYEAVSPISVRCIEEDHFEWAVALPGIFFGVDLSSLSHSYENAEHVWVPERRVAFRRYSGHAVSKRFVVQRDKLLAALVRDGLLDKEQSEESRRVWSRIYDSKLGFNQKGEPCIANYGSTQGIPRINEIAVELD